MLGKTDSYAACELVRPLVPDDGKHGFTQYAYTIKARGNAKSMRSLAKKNGGNANGWITALCGGKVGERVFFSLPVSMRLMS